MILLPETLKKCHYKDDPVSRNITLERRCFYANWRSTITELAEYRTIRTDEIRAGEDMWRERAYSTGKVTSNNFRLRPLAHSQNVTN